MIRIAVVDDEKAICDELLFFLQEYEMKFKAIFDISIYYNGENLLADLEDDMRFDLMIDCQVKCNTIREKIFEAPRRESGN